MSDEEQTGDIVCPLWNVQDHRFVARHYAAWRRKCRVCGLDVAVSRQQKKQADAANLQYVCEQCNLLSCDSSSPT